MSSDTWAAVIAGASGVFGGIVVAGSNYLLGRVQAKDARKAELRKALAEFLYVIGRIDHQLQIEPESGAATTWINDLIAQYPPLDYALGRLHQTLFTPRLDLLVERAHQAMAAVIVIAPLEVMPGMEAVSELMARAPDRDEQWQSEWREARTGLVVACRQALDEPVGSS